MPFPERPRCTRKNCLSYRVCKCGRCGAHCTHPENPELLKKLDPIRAVTLSRRPVPEGFEYRVLHGDSTTRNPKKPRSPGRGGRGKL